HAPALGYRSLAVVSEPVAAERIRRDVDDAHHVRAAAPIELASADIGAHPAIIRILRGDMRLADLGRGVPGAAVEGNSDVEVSGIAYDSRRVHCGDLFLAVSVINADSH